MPRLHFPFLKQACRLLCWLACLFLCSTAIAQPAASGQKKPVAKESTLDSADNLQPSLDFEQRVEKSISRLGSIEDKNVSESSGLAIAATPGCFWTMNDSGNPTELFLFGSTGQKLAQIKLTNARNKDWEAMASFTLAGQRWGLVADVGDNQRLIDAHRLYFFEDPTDAVAKREPNKKSGFTSEDFEKLNSVRAMPFEFSYAANLANKSSDSNDLTTTPAFVRQDCEAVAVDPTTLDIWFVEKVHLNRDRKVVPGIYVLPMPKSQLALHAGDLSAASAVVQDSAVKPVARRIGSFPTRYVSGMSFSPDGQKLIVRNYLTAHLFIRPDNKTWQQTVVEQKPMIIALPLQGQGEAICFAADSQSVIVTSEGVRQPIWKIDLQVYLDKFNSQK